MPPHPLRRVGVLWPRLGPYHLARLRAAYNAFASRGLELVALETAGDDQTYAWDVEAEPEAFERHQAFPGRVYDQIAPREMHRGVANLLTRLNLDGIAITSYSTPDAQAALRWCRRHRRTAVCMLATKADDTDRHWLRELAKAQIVCQYDAALVGGSPQRRYLASLGFPPDRIYVPYNAVDNAFFEHRVSEIRAAGFPPSLLPGLDDPRPFFVSVNRFISIKNLPTLLKAYIVYRNRTPEAPWRLILVGDGPDRAMLEALVHSKDIPGVTFAGFQQVDALPEYYARAG
ncbi:MAG: glycosyltransferase, partial [Bacteroidota bacterium]